MHVLIVAADLGLTALFDLVVAQEVSSVLDLRAVGDSAPRWLERVYHRPPKVLAEAVFRRVVSDWCSTSPGAANPALLVLIDRERLAETRGRVLALRPEARIEVVQSNAENGHR